MWICRFAFVLAALAAASPARAGDLALSFKGGLVTVNATNASLREILAEWARQGQTRVVGLEKVTGAPMTLVLKDVTEKQALEVLLRSLAGYIAAPRPAGATGTSFYDRIVLLPTSVASAAPPPSARPNAFAPPPPPASFPDPMQIANEEISPNDSPNPPGVPVFNPNIEPVNPNANGTNPANGVTGPNGVNSAPQPIPLGQSPIRPYQSPNDATNGADGSPPATPAPLTTGRPGVIPIPQNPPKP
jgi:hypothetical protein